MASIQPYSRGRQQAPWLGLTALLQPQSPPADVLDTWRLKTGAVVTLRAVRPDDGLLMQALVRGLSLTSRYHRFFYALHELTPDMLERFTHADPMHSMTLLVVVQDNGKEIAVGMAQYVADPYPERCEFAVVVADAWQRNGIAMRLIRNLMCIARAAGIERIEGDVLTENDAMQQLLRRMDFSVGAHPDDRHLVKTWKMLLRPAWKGSPLAALAVRGHVMNAHA